MEDDSQNKIRRLAGNGADRVPSRATWPPAWLAEPMQAAVLMPVTAETTRPAQNPADVSPGPDAPLRAPLQLLCCPRCDSTRYVDVVLRHEPHNGRSTRRDCAQCGRFWDFLRWYASPGDN